MTPQEQLQQMEAELYEIRERLFVLDRALLELYSPEVQTEEKHYVDYRQNPEAYQADWQPTQFSPMTQGYAKTVEELVAENQRKVELEARMAVLARQHGLTWKPRAIADFP